MENLMRVLLIVTGSIAIKKSSELIKKLSDEKVDIDCIITKSGLSIIKSLNIKSYNKCNIFTDNDFESKSEMLHINLSRNSEAIIVCPASANIIAKYANGIADDLASTTLLSTNKSVFMIPAMNVEMWNNTANQDNVTKLKNKMGINFVGPIYGNLACKEIGLGRIANTKNIINELKLYLTRKKLFTGLRGVVTSGPTLEPLDSVRYISNYSSGKQGYAIAKVLSLMGAEIQLISGPCNINVPNNVKVTNISSAKEMNSAVMDLLPADFAICTAAVTDFRPINYSFSKLKKNSVNSISLTENPDILYNISNSKKKTETCCWIFC